jgi:hypothetical protein
MFEFRARSSSRLWNQAFEAVFGALKVGRGALEGGKLENGRLRRVGVVMVGGA